MISGVCVQYVCESHNLTREVTETHSLKINGHCDTAVFISMYDITMAQP